MLVLGLGWLLGMYLRLRGILLGMLSIHRWWCLLLQDWCWLLRLLRLCCC